MRPQQLLCMLLGFASCAEEGQPPCVVGSRDGCDTPLVCEEEDGQPACVPEFVLEGRVLDQDAEGIAGAHVVALDASGSPLGLGVTDLRGGYQIRILWPRDADARPLQPPAVTLFVSAPAYQPFPLPPRVAIPVDLSRSTLEEVPARFLVSSSSTDVLLLPIQGDSQGLAAIKGQVIGQHASGVLMVATQSGVAVSSAVSGVLGEFSLFNVPEGDTELLAFKAGVRYPGVSVQVLSPETKDVIVTPASGGLTHVSGAVTLVNASGSFNTSVVLVPEVLFDATAVRGESPAGLRADDVTGAFSIEGVPPGRFVALAAFENDGLVRDPDVAIGGTEYVVFETSAQGGPLPLGDHFKITRALDVVTPGAVGVETVNTLPITLEWKDDSSEMGYDLVIYDAYGSVVHQADNLPSVSGGKDGNPRYVWQGLDATPGMIYQFRVQSWRGDTWTKSYLRQTEDLKGVFLYSPKT